MFYLIYLFYDLQWTKYFTSMVDEEEWILASDSLPEDNQESPSRWMHNIVLAVLTGVHNCYAKNEHRCKTQGRLGG